MKSKRIIALILTTVLLLTSLSFPAAASLYDKAEAPYPDILMSQWYALDCIYVCENGIMTYMKTYSDGEQNFCPQEKATREMIVTIFWNLYDNPAPSSESSFSDVIPGKWYYNAVSWAEEIGLSFGVSKSKFGINQSITREQLATFFYRYAQLQGKDLEIKGTISTFSDYQSVSGWASEAMSWAVGEGIITGTGNNRLSPKATATRAEIAAIIHRYFVPNQVRLTKIEVADPPRAAYYITDYQWIKIWGKVSFNLYYSDGTMETVKKHDRLPYPYLNPYPIYKNGVPYGQYSLFGVSTYIPLNEVKTMPSPPIDFDAAIAAGHKYAETEYGFQTTVDFNPYDKEASFMTPSLYTMQQLEVYGGQDYIIDVFESKIDVVYNNFVKSHKEHEIPYATITCYVEYNEDTGLYTLYALYH